MGLKEKLGLGKSKTDREMEQIKDFIEKGYYINAQGDVFENDHTYRKVKIEPTTQQHLIAQSKRLCQYGKHIGSKSTWRLRNSIKQASYAAQNPLW